MQAEVNGKIYDIKLVLKEGNNIRVSLDGKIIDLDIEISESGFCSLLYEENSYNAEIVCLSEGKYSITSNFKHFDIQLNNPQIIKQKDSQKNRIDKTQESIISHMPGKIVQLLVKENQNVKKGEPLLIIEAMKMQNTYTSTQDAIVEKIVVNQGDSVLKGQLLISLKCSY